jgi:hypothetical protein
VPDSVQGVSITISASVRRETNIETVLDLEVRSCETDLLTAAVARLTAGTPR